MAAHTSELPPRSAAATRERVRLAALELFAEHGYDGTSLRDVAGAVGVDVAYVHRLFAGKEGLLRAAIDLPVDPERILAGIEPGPNQGREVVAAFLSAWSQPEVAHGIRAIIRVALSHEIARQRFRELMSEAVLRRLPVGDDHAPLRAALVGSQMAGLALTRYILGFPPLVYADDALLIDVVGETVQRYLTADLQAMERET